MTCEHCTHCQNAEKTQQTAANAYELGTELNHPDHGRVVYWRADMDSSGRPTGWHYVHLAGDEDELLFSVHGNRFTEI